MKANQNNKNNTFEEDSIDILNHIKKIWKEKLLIIKVSIFFFFIGCLVAFISPVKYSSQTTFIPQVSGDDKMSSTSNQLGSLASLAGINLKSSETNDSYLSPLVYINIIDSEEFSLNLLGKELIDTKAKKFTVKEYLLSKEGSFNFDLIGFVKKYTIDLFSNDKINEIDSKVSNEYNFINDEDYSLIRRFRKKFSIDLNERYGYIKVTATDENPFISSQLVNLITKSLQSKIIEIRTNKINERLKFSKEQYDLKQSEFDLLQRKLAEFKDSNKNISTASFRSELQKLESEYQLQQNILINLASEYNNNKIKLNKDTPIFSVIDEVSVPNQRSKPKRGLLVVIFVILGLVLSIGFVLVKEPINNLTKEIND